ncbi:unnamed protein product [Leptidea sinapis]|uniref:Uncharacterized protein n=1 Tax=Leptidea sinapis TaxID=189913 RepID=A0A5E4R727_9NEOP|nr:unnamed protein product [Leptidea sinapis]
MSEMSSCCSDASPRRVPPTAASARALPAGATASGCTAIWSGRRVSVRSSVRWRGWRCRRAMYSPAAAMYAAAAGYPGYIGYPVQYYPYYPAANGFEAGGRFEGLAQTLLPPAPPTVPPSPGPAHLAALQPHQVL